MPSTLRGPLTAPVSRSAMRVIRGTAAHVTVFDRTGDVVGEVWDAEDFGIGHIAFTPDGEHIVGDRYPLERRRAGHPHLGLADG